MSNLPSASMRDHRIGRARACGCGGSARGCRRPDRPIRPQLRASSRRSRRARGSCAAPVTSSRTTQPSAMRIGALDILVVGADIADVREGEGDDLPGVGRIGHHLLIAGHRGVEADFADRLALGAEALAPDRRCRRRGPERRSRALGLRRRGARPSAVLGSAGFSRLRRRATAPLRRLVNAARLRLCGEPIQGDK